MPDPLHEFLGEGLRSLSIDAAPGVVERLLAYLELMRTWNARMNLTAIREPRSMVTHHLLDSLSILGSLHGQRCLDVGTGAGLPGVPLALVAPTMDWTLLDSRGKKTRFVQQVVSELGMKQVKVVHQRVEDFAPGDTFDTIVSRAVTDVNTLLCWCARLLSPGGQLLVMAGQAQRLPERMQAGQHMFQIQQQPLWVPTLSASRHLVIVKEVNV